MVGSWSSEVWVLLYLLSGVLTTKNNPRIITVAATVKGSGKRRDFASEESRIRHSKNAEKAAEIAGIADRIFVSGIALHQN